MKLKRTFHVPTESHASLNITECGNTVLISIDDKIMETVSPSYILTRDQFEALCELRYEIKWDRPEVE